MEAEKTRSRNRMRSVSRFRFRSSKHFFAPVAVRRREPRRDVERSTERPRASTRKERRRSNGGSYPLYLERSAISTAFIDRVAKQTLKRRPFVGTIEKIAIFVQQNRPDRRVPLFRQKLRDRQKRSRKASASERSNKSVPLFNFNLLRAIRKKKFSLFKDFSGKFPLPQRFLQL